MLAVKNSLLFRSEVTNPVKFVVVPYTSNMAISQMYK